MVRMTAITFVVPNVAQARYLKRIDFFRDLYSRVRILGFRRKYYPGRANDYEFIDLGYITSGKYHRRLRPYLKAARILKAETSTRRACVWYLFGVDMLLLFCLVSMLSGKKPTICYEVGDVREIMTGDSIYSALLRFLERWCVTNRVGLLVVTSQAFVDEYYERWLGLSGIDYFVLENKVHAKAIWGSGSTSSNKRKQDGVIWVGYFGLLRCPRSLEILFDVAAQASGKIRILLRGYLFAGAEKYKAMAASVKNVVFEGPFVSPDDLQGMYRAVDIVWACYPFHKDVSAGNWRWAKTNRFYESCFFQRPMFVQEHTEDAISVSRYDIGLALDLGDPAGCVKKILNTGWREIKFWEENLKRIPRDVCEYSDEHQRLLNRLTRRNTDLK